MKNRIGIRLSYITQKSGRNNLVANDSIFQNGQAEDAQQKIHSDGADYTNYGGKKKRTTQLNRSSRLLRQSVKSSQASRVFFMKLKNFSLINLVNMKGASNFADNCLFTFKQVQVSINQMMSAGYGGRNTAIRHRSICGSLKLRQAGLNAQCSQAVENLMNQLRERMPPRFMLKTDLAIQSTISGPIIMKCNHKMVICRWHAGQGQQINLLVENPSKIKTDAEIAPQNTIDLITNELRK
ncbi:hypothetical protein COOONC_18351 [Cooperia oncophora]